MHRLTDEQHELRADLLQEQAEEEQAAEDRYHKLYAEIGGAQRAEWEQQFDTEERKRFPFRAYRVHEQVMERMK